LAKPSSTTSEIKAKLDYTLLRLFFWYSGRHIRLLAKPGGCRVGRLCAGTLGRGVWAGWHCAAALHGSRAEHDHFVIRIVAGISAQCCTRWMHYRSGASLGADIPVTANHTDRAKGPFLSKSVSRASYVSDSRVLEACNLHVRSVARDPCQSSHTCSHTTL